MASTESKIRLIFDGVERGVVAAAAKAKAAVKSLSDENDKLSKSFDTLDKGVSKVGAGLLGIAKGITVLGTAAAAGHVIAGTVGSLAQLAPIALALPGALLVAGAAFGTLAIATSGFNDAIAAGLHGDMAAYNEAIAAMPPAMRDAAKAVVSFRGELNQLKTAVQGAFWEKFSGDITALGNNLLPTLKQGMRSIAAELGNMVKGAVQVASTPFFRGQLASILVSTRATIENMRPALGNVLAGFVSLGEVGATFLPRLGTAITNVTTQFKAWATSVEGQNQIKTFIEGAITGFKDLAGIVKNVGSILGSIFTGLGGSIASPLASLKELTAELAAFLKTAEAQEGLKALGEILQEAGTAIKEVFLAAVKELLPTIKEWAPAIKEIIGGLKDFALDIIHTVGPALRGLGKFLSENKDTLRDLIPFIAGAVLAFKGLKILVEVTTWARNAHAALKILAGILPLIKPAPGAVPGLKGLVPVLKGIAGVVGLGLIAKGVDEINIAAAGGDPANLQGMAADLHELVSAGERLLSGDFSVIDENIRDITTEAEAFVRVWQDGKAPIQQFFLELDRWINPISSQLRTNLIPAVAGVEAGFRGLPKTVGESLVSLADTIVGFGTKVTAPFNEEIKAGFEQTRVIVAGVPAAIVNALSPLGGLLGNQGATSGAQFTTQIGIAFEKSRQIAAGVPAAIVNALSPLGGLLGNQGATSGASFATQIAAAFERSRRETAAVPGRIVQALSPLGGQLGNTGATAGAQFDSRLSGAINTARENARRATATIAGAISGALGGLGATGANAGAALGAGLVRGLNSMFSQVQRAASAIANVAARAVAAAGVIRSPSRLWADFGRQFGAGLVVGLNDSQSSVALASSRLISTASGTAGFGITAPNSSAGAVQQLASSLQSRSQEPLQVRVFIGDTELTDIVRTEVNTSNRATRRTVGAGAGTTF